ncbi:hypothetical protein [Morganella morganii]|uniref:hypothetical protein n=1 Tax=Morganella morganii TaxID=582 RepID=UPI0030FF1263
MRLQQWATENIKKLLYLAGDDAVINYGKMRLEFLQKALAQDTSGDFCFRVLHPEVSGPPDMKKASARYRDFIIGNRALLDKYGDSFLTDDPYVLAEDKLQTCQMEIDLMADVLKAPPRESAELIRYVFADEWPE